ncbi:MAG: T9SS type A sorting domain-containing protein [Bacteroidales bacterium]
MKKILFCGVMLLIFMVAQAQTPWTGSVATEFGGGTGISTNPYLIKTPEQLAKLASDVNKGIAYKNVYFKIENNLDLGGKNTPWTPIGNGFSGRIQNVFGGILDGNFKMIDNMYIDLPKESSIGLVGILGGSDSAELKNIVIAKTCTITGGSYVGAVVGWSKNGSVSNCVNMGKVSGYKSYIGCIGGIVGYFESQNTLSKLSNCINVGLISGWYKLGGIAGKGSSISNSFNCGRIEEGMGNVGGIVGMGTGLIENSYNVESISANTFLGGIVGFLDKKGIVKNCYNTAPISGINDIYSIAPAAKTSYIDAQTCVGLIDNMAAIPLTNAKMINDSSAFNFSDKSQWQFTSGYYPQLKVFVESPSQLIRSLSALSVAPLIFNNEETTWALKSDFSVPIKTTLDETLTWSTDATGILNFNNGKVVFTKPTKDTSITITASIPNALEKRFKITYSKLYGHVAEPNKKKEYQIRTAEELAWISAVYNGAVISSEKNILPSKINFQSETILLMNDIDLSAYQWVPIGAENNAFAGIFDGRFYNIKNLNLHILKENIGFFGQISSRAILRNFGIIGKGSTTGLASVGGICGVNDGGLIENCHNSNPILGQGSNVGGIVSINQTKGIVQNSYNTGLIKSIESGSVGGIVGINQSESLIRECYNTGDIMGEKQGIGGIAGLGGMGEISNCYNKGVISSKNDLLGGIAGMSSSGAIYNCYSAGKVIMPEGYIGDVLVGSIAGKHNGPPLENCYYDKDVCSIGAIATKDILSQAEGKTTQQMTSGNFAKTLNANQEYTPWYEDPQKTNQGYPLLSWQEGAQSIDNEKLQDKQSNSIQIYPNPTRNTINLIGTEIKSIQLLNLHGQILKDIHSASRQTQMDVSKLTDGIYILRVLNNENKWIHLKFIKQN